MNPRLRAVFRKELRDLRRNKFVVGSMVALPLFFVLLPTLSVLYIGILKLTSLASIITVHEAVHAADQHCRFRPEALTNRFSS